MVKIFIIILNFNGWRSTIDLFSSLEKIKHSKKIHVESIIVDNGSSDNSTKFIREKLPDVLLLETGENLGFTGGNNYGIKYAIKKGADYVVILNNDTRVDRDFISKLYDAAITGENIGGVLPKIYFEKGFEFHKSKYAEKEKGKVIWYAGGLMDWDNLIGKNRGVDEVDYGQYDTREETNLATGCCFMVNAEVFKKIGLFDDKYFLYYEDADLTERMKKAGYKILYEPKAVIWHKNAESSGGSGSELQDYYITRNRLLFGIRYASFRTKAALVKESISFLRNGRSWQKQGVIDFYLKRFGRGSYVI